MIEIINSGIDLKSEIRIHPGSEFDGPLHFVNLAIFYNLETVLREILKHEVKPGIVENNMKKNSSLHISCKNRNSNITKLLLHYKLDLEIRNWSGDTAFKMCFYDDYYSNHYYASGLKTKIPPCFESACELLKMGAEINCWNNEGKTPLIIACEFGDKNIVKFLLENGAQVHYRDSSFATALTYSKWGDNKNSDIEKLLLEAKGEHCFETDLIHFCNHNSHEYNINEILKEIFESKINADFIDEKTGKSPLIEAARDDKTNNILVKLIEIGGNPHLENRKKETPAKIAQKNMAFNNLRTMKIQYEEKTEEIDYKSFLINGSYFESDINFEEISLDMILGMGIGINSSDILGRTAISSAIIDNKTNLVKLLIDRGADVNQTNKFGETYLMLTAMHADRKSMNDCIEIMNILYDAGADIEKTDKNGRKFADCGRGHYGRHAVKDLLKKHKANQPWYKNLW